MKLYNLKCEFLKNPLGIDIVQPRLSWEMNDKRRGACQQAYQLQMAESIDGLISGNEYIWDSGRVNSSQSHLVSYDGPLLKSGQKIYWHVRVWDKDGQLSEWSEPAFWSMGFLSEDWDNAKWIGLNRPGVDATSDETIDIYRRLPARYLRREFIVDSQLYSATVTICGLGVYDLHVNGVRITEELVMNPAQTDFDKRVLYQAFDITPWLTEGKNTIGVVLGNGRYYALRPDGHRDFGFPRLIFHLKMLNANGLNTVVVSDDEWRITDQGPIRANHEYDGEIYDARMEMPEWDTTGFDDSGWDPVEIVAAPGGKLAAGMLEPTRITGVLKPKAIQLHQTGVWLVDFGEVTYGQPRLRISGSAGTVIKVIGAYSLRRDSTLKTEDNRGARCTDLYILKGDGEEVWSPRFRGQGCRWVEISGWPGEMKPENIEMLVVRHGADDAGNFECSHPLLTRIYENVGRGVKAFLRQGLPMEPDRDERQPWLGDPACGSRSYAAYLQVAPFLRKWLADIRMSQNEDGSIPAIAPMYWAFNCKTDAVWPAVITILPEWIYRHYGDMRVIEENYSTACRWVKYLEKQMRPDGTTDNCNYGDWCDTASMDIHGHDYGATSHSLIASAYLCHSARLLAKMAIILKQPDDAVLWQTKADKWKNAFNQRFFNSVTAKYESETQCAMLLPLAFNLVPENDYHRVIENLATDIMDTNNGHTTVGLIGNQWLLPTLSAAGRQDVAYTIATQTTRPSWGYMVSKGATSIWERWDSDTCGPGMNSEALLIQAGSLGAWFIESLAGITPHPDGPGFMKFNLQPCLASGLDWLRAEVNTPYGVIVSNWHYEDEKWIWNIIIPPNTTAVIHIPSDDLNKITENGNGINSVPGILKLSGIQNGKCICHLTAGVYCFNVKNAIINNKTPLVIFGQV